MKVRHMNADLVGPTCLELNREQAVPWVTLQYSIMGHGRPTASNNRHPRALSRMTPDRRFHAATSNQLPNNQSAVLTMNRSQPQLIDQRLVSNERLGHHKKATGVFIEPVDDAGPRHFGKRRSMM